MRTLSSFGTMDSPVQFPPPLNGKEVISVADILHFLVSIAANVLSVLICKWLDGHGKDR